MDNSESFRNEISSRLYGTVPQDQLKRVLDNLDSVLAGYEVTRKQLSIIPATGMQEVVKFFIASKAVKNLSPGTLHIYTLRMNDFFARVNKPYTEIRANDIRMYLYYYKTQRNASDAYLDNIRRVINSFFTWLVNDEYLLKNPCASVENVKYEKKQRSPMTSYEVEKLRWNCKTVREKAMIDFFFSTGVRLNECRTMNIADIDFDNRSALVRHGKGNKTRTVYFDAEAEVSLQKYLESRNDDCEALFVTERKPARRMCVKAIENILNKVADRTSLHVYPHRLRHTFATIGLRRGIPIEKIQALMGHQDTRTTLIYAHLADSDLRAAHQKAYA